MVKIYTSTGCLGCRLAIKFFKKHNIEFAEKNFIKIPLTKKELLDILSLTENGFEDILSLRSKHYKKYKKIINDIQMDDFIKLIIDDPQILSRPIMVEYQNNEPYRLLIGYNSQDISIFLNDKKTFTSKKILDCGMQDECPEKCGNNEEQKQD